MCVQCPRLSPPRPQTKQTEQWQICVLLLRLLSVVHRNDRDNIHKCTRPTTFVAIERCSVAHCSGVLLRVVRIGFVRISTAFSHPVVAQCTMRGDLKSRRTLLRTNNRKQQPPPENSSHTNTVPIPRSTRSWFIVRLCTTKRSTQFSSACATMRYVRDHTA